MQHTPTNTVRRHREHCGLTQVALAAQTDLSRQSIHAIESGRSVPSVDVALRLARALGCGVEEIFGGGTGGEHVVAALEPLTGGERVMVANVGGRWIPRPLRGDLAIHAADGLVAPQADSRDRVELVRPLNDVQDNVVMLGCAAGLGVLADRLNGATGAGRFFWFPSSSGRALAALTEQSTHIAGVHLIDGETGEANLPDVRRLLAREPLVVITLARWRAGLVTRPAHAGAVADVAALADPALRLIVREQGSGARRLFDRELAAAGLGPARTAGAPVAAGHHEVARTVAMGSGDAGVATEDAARAWGLHFVPLAEERYDLVLPTTLLGDRRIARLFDVLSSALFRRELTALGYDTSASGTQVAEVAAA